DWRRLIRRAGPGRTDVPSELPRPIVTGRHERVHLAALVYRHLCDDVSGGAESIDSEVCAASGHSIRSISDQARAERRRRMLVVVGRRKRKAEPGISDNLFCIAAVDLIAGVACAPTEILPPAPTELALPT